MDHRSAGFDPYRVLGVGRGATLSEIAHARRILARQHHPDLDGSATSDEQMRRINLAWQVLSDPIARRAWDLAHKDFSGPQVTRATWAEWRAPPSSVRDPSHRAPGRQESHLGWWILGAFLAGLVLMLGAGIASTVDRELPRPQPPGYHDNFN